MNTGIRIVGHGDSVSLEVDVDSLAARRELGMWAWTVLEVLALAGHDEGGTWVTTTNARDLGARLGIGKDRAAAALGVLRAAGLVVAHAGRDGISSRFAPGRYEVRLPFAPINEVPLPRSSRAPLAARPRARREASTPETLDLFSAP